MSSFVIDIYTAYLKESRVFEVDPAGIPSHVKGMSVAFFSDANAGDIKFIFGLSGAYFSIVKQLGPS